jgi:hypothetical protein
MWRYLGPSCLDRSFTDQLMDVEVGTQVQRILALGLNRCFGSRPVPLRDRVASP